MRLLINTLLGLALIGVGSAPASPETAAPRPLLVTVDDLPLTGAAPDSPAERRALTRAHLAALGAQGIRAVGFVTWKNVRGPADVELLKMWLDAGHELGNHSDQHLSYTTTEVEAYRADIEGARARLQELLAHRDRQLRFFRFPFLREGDSEEKLDAMRRYLAESGQRNLAVTIDNQDWSFDRPFVEARRSGDRRRQAEVAADYQSALRLAVRHHEAAGDRLLGRPAPQVLLLHANSIGGSEWPQLFAWLAKNGHRFADADEVLADPAFSDLPRVVAPYGYGLWDRLSQLRDETEAKRAVAALLTTQAEAWTTGDLHAFCAVYADDALFISPSGQTRGRQAVLERYRKRYPDRAAMGTLTLEVIEMRPLSGVEVTPQGDAVPGHVHGLSVAARWTLRYPEKETATGLTLLVLRRDGKAWRIVQDASF
ncbi:MAG TPA: SgcJ/EcaC family oxidoreductase [Vicinamibacteria bacterium]|nr:SgcJ/EcaC family oxidoreductase [Vicinamibacteria bacterium]